MKMLIGLTGRTGSGKSSAAKIFESLGAFVADCDKIAHEVLRDEIVKQKLCALFSSDILDKSGEITSNEGFSVVAPIRVITPCSTAPKRESCCDLLNR